jgi:glycosyltransferase involved in cell wall biosynthesis
MRERGWEFVFYVDDPSPMADELREAGYRVHGRERNVGYSLQWLRHDPGPARKLRTMPAWFAGLRRALRAERPDLVHANSLYTAAEAILARQLGYPTVLHVHEMLPYNWKGPAARRVLRAARLVPFAVSTASAQRLAGEGATAPIVYESTVLPEHVVPAPGGERLVVGFIGHIARRKGTDLFVEAARRIIEAGHPIDFRMVGEILDNPDRPWGEDVVRRAQAAGIDYLPHGRTFELFRGWDVVVLPARKDPFPLVVLEAMASGRPVIGADTDGIPEQLGGEAGIIVPSDEADALERAILDLAADPERRARMAAAGLARAPLFVPERQADQLEAVYRDVLKGSPASAAMARP